MNPVLRDSAAHIFVPSLPEAAISGDDEHHLDVLRVQRTDVVTVSDGAGRWATAVWSRRDGLVLTGDVHVDDPGQTLGVGCAIAKGDRHELVVQKLTELGIDRIMLFETTRSVVRWDIGRRDRQLERLRRISREAAMQSRRVRLPVVEHVDFGHAVGMEGAAIAEPGGTDPLDCTVSVVLIGPEGGFTAAELAHPVPRVALSRHVLRVETAAIAAGVLLTVAHAGDV